MLSSQARIAALQLRHYAINQPAKPSIKLVAELRKRTEISIAKAREALSASDNDLDSALQWLQKDLVVSGAKKAAKVQDRIAGEGLIGISVLSGGATARSPNGGPTILGGVRASMVELNCETDFVARNSLFIKLVVDIAFTAAFFAESQEPSSGFIQQYSIDALHGSPIVNPRSHATANSTIRDAITETISKLGEKISLRRAVHVVSQGLPRLQENVGLRVASYVHGSPSSSSPDSQNIVPHGQVGRIGALALLAFKGPQFRNIVSTAALLEELERLERSLARQIVGFDTRSIQPQEGETDESALYHQPFMMLGSGGGSENVRAVLDSWAKERGLEAIEAIEFTKWTVGEAVEEMGTTIP